MNMIDKLVSRISPQAGLNRAVARRKLEMFNSGYGNHGASRGKSWDKGWDWLGGSPHDDIDLSLPVLRQRSRDLYSGGGFARGALATMRTSIVGPGMTVGPQIDSDFLGMSREEAANWQRTTSREFDIWARSVDCDADRQNNFYELQQLAQLSWLMSGDVFAIPLFMPCHHNLYSLCVRLIEADLVCTPGLAQDTGIPTRAEGSDNLIFSGVEVARSGEVVAYHIANRHPLAMVQNYVEPLEWVRVDAFGHETGRPNVLHLMEHERPGQRRGVPFLAPVMEELKQLARYIHSEQMNAVVGSMFSVFIESEAPNGELGEAISPEQRIDDDPNTYELGSGNIVGLGIGEKPHFANPNRTNTAFESFITSLCMSIGSALEIPYEILLKRFNSSYTASKAANNEFWRVVRMRRRWLVDDFCQPVYEEFLTEAVAKGRIIAPGFFDDPAIRAAYCNAEWHGPAPGHLNPLDEVKAADMRVLSGYSTRQQETAEINGGDWAENIRQCADEQRALSETQTGGGAVEKTVDDNEPRE